MQEQFPYVDLRPMLLPERPEPADPVDSEVARLIPEMHSRQHGILPFAIRHDKVHVAVSRPVADDELLAVSDLGLPVQLWRTHPAHLEAAQDRVWSQSVGDSVNGGGNPRLGRRLGEILVDMGAINDDELGDALRQQATAGGRLGMILINANRASPLAIASAVAQQRDLPLTELLSHRDGRQELHTLDPALFSLMPMEFWRDHLLVPLELREDHLLVAMVDPGDTAVAQRLHREAGFQVRATVTGQRDVYAALQMAYRHALTEESRFGLKRRRPEDSASRTLTGAQKGWGIALTLLAAAGLYLWTFATLAALNAVAQIYYLGLTFYKLGLVARRQLTHRGIEFTATEVADLDKAELPIYTVLVPAYREGGVLPILARALAELDYPHDRLDVKLLLEEDDVETIAVARSLHLPNFISIVVIPPSEPRTKPKACNYGLQLARGEYTVIFDAEDIPEPDQLLKAVAAFRKSGAEIACVQAKLAYFNRGQNLLTRWFTAEYLMWFDLLLPSLHAARLPIPLGGTSNHFRTAVLRGLGAWDPYNVAEDADLGIRLHKAGYLTAIIDSTTFEEATSQLDNWIRQRSRWVKGYIQTWLVHMRHPIALRRSLGTSAFLGFQIIVGGTPLTLLLNPVYALLTTLWYLTHAGVLEALLPGWVYLVAATNLFLGNLAFTSVNMVAVARRNIWDLMAWTALSPIYWTVMSIAAWKAAIQLVTRPSYWEKTDHGMTVAPTVPVLETADIRSSAS